MRAYLDERERTVRAGSLLRRRSRSTACRCATCRRTRGRWRSSATCSSAPTPPSLPTFDPNFTVLHAPEFQADPAKHGTRTSTVIVLNLAKRMILIGGTRYAGELKKSMFTVMNYYMPKQGVLSMHCSANIGEGGDTALFFGLSGTGKTTLSADPTARSSATTSTAGRRRRVQLRRRLLREGASTCRPKASRTSIARRRCSARSSRTSCSIR